MSVSCTSSLAVMAMTTALATEEGRISSPRSTSPPNIGVSVGPGYTVETRTPFPSSSARRPLASARSACLLAAYGALRGRAAVPAPEFTSTTVPRASRRAGRACRTSAAPAVTLRAKTRSQSASAVSSTRVEGEIPAAWTRASTRSGTSAARSPVSRSAARGVISAEASSSCARPSRSRPTAITRQPSSASCRATSRPIPLVAPVTRAVRGVVLCWSAVVMRPVCCRPAARV